MSGLRGAGVLITRPVHQSGELARLVERAGGVPILLPTIGIRPAIDDLAIETLLREMPAYDLAIFVSSNAVNYGKRILNELATRKIPLAAIGPATAGTMANFDCPPDIVPVSGFNSEALLAEPMLREIEGKKVLIVRGLGGREMLEQDMRQRGASVSSAEVYQRRCAEHSTGEIEAIEDRWADGGVRVVTAYSVESLENLFTILSESGRRLLRATWLVTISQRIAKKARFLGIAQPALVAASPDDQSVVATIIELAKDN